MLDKHFLDELARKISGSLPDSAQQVRNDIEKNVRVALVSLFERMDLVTRQELETQKAVLARTREKIEELEQKITELEKSTGRPND